TPRSSSQLVRIPQSSSNLFGPLQESSGVFESLQESAGVFGYRLVATDQDSSDSVRTLGDYQELLLLIRPCCCSLEYCSLLNNIDRCSTISIVALQLQSSLCNFDRRSTTLIIAQSSLNRP
ncbi:hypothetical protein PGT21_024724, partial [Puccinia graminis f. sp. tritici]